MDNLTHSLVAVALSRVFFKGRAPFATTALVIAANLPDLDIVFGWNGASYLTHHRGVSHSLLAWAVWTVLVAIGLRWAARWRLARRERRRRERAGAIAFGGGAATGSAAVVGVTAGPALRSLPVDELMPPEREKSGQAERVTARRRVRGETAAGVLGSGGSSMAGSGGNGGGDAGGDAGGSSAQIPGPRAGVNSVPSWRLALALGAVGVGSHLLLDWTTGYGVRFLAPFSQRWLSLDWEPVVDPWIWALLLLLLLAPMVLGLVGGEMGVRRQPHRLSALVALLLLGGWIGARGYFHHRAVAMLSDRAITARAPTRVAAFALPGTPFVWRGVAELPDRYELATLDAGAESVVTLVPVSIFKPHSSPQLDLAKSTALGAAFFRFARFPVAYTRRGEDGATTVLLTDARFLDAGDRPQMGVVVREDRFLHLVSAHLDWRGADADAAGDN